MIYDQCTKPEWVLKYFGTIEKVGRYLYHLIYEHHIFASSQRSVPSTTQFPIHTTNLFKYLDTISCPVNGLFG